MDANGGPHDGPARPRPSWLGSDRRLPRVVLRPALRLAEVEAAGAVVMLGAAVVALAWANSPWRDRLATVLATPVRADVGRAIEVDLTVHEAVNDGLMTLFFLLAGLEIKRQLVLGELRDRRAAALPAIAALGGMVLPPALFLALNAGQPGARGWGIPVATDIAFAIGVVTLAGQRVSVGARVFVLTLAVVDDVGGIIVIAVFYANDVHVRWLLFSAACVGAAVVVRRADVRSLAPYLAAGAGCWYGLHHAGVEPALTGVVFGLVTPAHPFHNRADRARAASGLLARLDAEEAQVDEVARYLLETEAPLVRIEQRLNLWVSFLIMPAFALANAGVRFDLSEVDGRVVAGTGVGLVAGKALGVSLGAWAAVRLGVGRLPDAVSWRQLVGLALTAGIGFTVALFVAGLSYTDAILVDSAKIGILAGSVVAGAAGYAVLRSRPAPERRGD